VTVTASSFDPGSVRVRRGGTVVWTNADLSAHELIDTTGLDLFDLPVDPGAFVAHSFVAAGRYRYACALHPTVTGVVTVPITASPAKGSKRTTFEVTWGSRTAPTGYAFDVQIRRPGGRWRLWKDEVTRAAAPFLADAGVGTYRFRARMIHVVDAAHAGWSTTDSIRVGS